MSLNRMALRQAFVLALTNYYTEPYPTIANGRVFDSRLDPIQGAGGSTDDLVPSISIYTDTDSGSGLSSNNGGPPFRRMVKVSIWLTMGMAGPSSEDGQPTVIFPQTDAELEATLDAFEDQVRRAILDLTNKWAVLLAGFWIRVTEWFSDRLGASANVRIAARNLTLTIEIKDDPMPAVVYEAPAGASPLPEHVQALLDAVQAEGPPRGGVAPTIKLLQSAAIRGPLVLPKLKTMWLGETHRASAPDKPITPAPQATTPDLNPD